MRPARDDHPQHRELLRPSYGRFFRRPQRGLFGLVRRSERRRRMNEVVNGTEESTYMRGRESSSSAHPSSKPSPAGSISPELFRSLADVKGQAQFLLYLADQIEESLEQLGSETDSCH